MRRGSVSYVIAVFLLVGLGACAPAKEDESPAPSPDPIVEVPPPVEPIETAATVVRPAYAEVLWKTTLGKSYNELLFANYPRELFLLRKKQLAQRIASENKKYAARVAVIQILNEDLYLTEKMNEDVRAKIQLLEAEVQRDHEEMQKSAVKTVAQHIPFVFLASLPWGSPLVRSEVRNFQKGWAHYVISRLRRAPAPRPQGVQWRALFSAKALENYEVGRPMSLFFQTVAPFSILELFLIQDVAGDLVGGEPSIEQMILMADF